MYQSEQELVVGQDDTLPCPRDLPPAPTLRLMLHDFVNIHQRAMSLVIGHELGRVRGGMFPPMDTKNEWVVFKLKVRDPKASPASIFQFTSGIAPLPLAGLEGFARHHLEDYAEEVAQHEDLAEKVKEDWTAVPTICKPLSHDIFPITDHGCGQSSSHGRRCVSESHSGSCRDNAQPSGAVSFREQCPYQHTVVGAAGIQRSEWHRLPYALE